MLLLILLTIQVRGASSTKGKERANKVSCCQVRYPVTLLSWIWEVKWLVPYFLIQCRVRVSRDAALLGTALRDAQMPSALSVSIPPVPPEPSAACPAALRRASILWQVFSEHSPLMWESLGDWLEMQILESPDRLELPFLTGSSSNYNTHR